MEKQLEIYNFNDDNDINLFNKISGIYGLVYVTYNTEEIVYVGQSKNIANRLKTHRRAKSQLQKTIDKYIASQGRVNMSKQMALYQFIDCNKSDLFFVVFTETDELDKWEEHYITLFKPRFNYKGVDVPYKTENTPEAGPQCLT